MSHHKSFILVFLTLMLLIIIPASFAFENDTLISQSSDVVSDDDLQSPGVYYYNASVEEDGDGSQLHPYKYIDESKLTQNSILYLADGEYSIRGYTSLSGVSIYGENANQTILRFAPSVTSHNSLNLANITIRGNIENYGTFTSNNVIFTTSLKSYDDRQILITNCTFTDTTNTAITLNKGSLTLLNSNFYNISSKSYGGAIVGESGTKITINDTVFNNCFTLDDAGGAIYLRKSSLTANNLTILNSYALFGGAITVLDSSINLTKSSFKNNTARYDGGALYAYHGDVYIYESNFTNNSALNGGAVFINEAYNNQIQNNNFINNSANLTSGAVYVFLSDKIDENNYYCLNTADKYDDLHETDSLNMFLGSSKYTMIKYSPEEISSLPTHYDLRDYGYVSSVKNQYSGGNCWAFAAIAALESSLLKAGLGEYDLSEENMKNLAHFYSDYGWAMPTNEGGYDDMAIGYLVSWLGPVNDSDDVYSDKSQLSPVLNSLFHIQNIAFLTRTSYTDNNAIKEAIMKYGAVATSLKSMSTKYQYYTGIAPSDHAAIIVGWDDNFSKDNFPGLKPEGDGAWIVKNSWGKNWENDGYFYVSYYDVSFARVGTTETTYVFILNDTTRLDKNYQYDIPGKTDYLITGKDTIWYKNIFTSTENEYLTSVSTYFEKVTDWQLTVKVNNAVQLIQNGISKAGYYTIDLDKNIKLNEGDVFEIVFRISSNDLANIPISEEVSLNRQFYTEGISYFSYDGVNWIDLYDFEWEYPAHTYASQVACIKAFTFKNILNSSMELFVEFNGELKITAKITDDYGCFVHGGSVEFDINGDKIKADVLKGIATLIYDKAVSANYIIKAAYNGAGYTASSGETSIDLTDVIKTTLTSSDLNTYYNDKITYSAALKDLNNNPLKGELIEFIIDGVKYASTTNGNGIASVNVNIACGSHNVLVKYSGSLTAFKSQSTGNIYVLSTVNVLSTNSKTLNSYYSVKFLDANGNPLALKQVSFNNNVVSTDKNGIALFKITQKPGTYTISIVNSQTSQKITQIIKVVARINSNVNVVKYFGGSKNYKVRVLDDDGNPVGAGKTVNFKINSKSYNVKTDKNGYATFKITLKAGKYTITATYNGFSVSNKITVKPVLSAKNIAKKKSKTVKFSAKLLNSNGKVFKNKKITFKIKGKKYTAKTNKKGIATISLKNLKVGKYTVTTTYGKSKITNKITIKK